MIQNLVLGMNQRIEDVKGTFSPISVLTSSHCWNPVSYTHLDVYKRQHLACPGISYTIKTQQTLLPNNGFKKYEIPKLTSINSVQIRYSFSSSCSRHVVQSYGKWARRCQISVSYTHLDVYKRQVLSFSN